MEGINVQLDTYMINSLFPLVVVADDDRPQFTGYCIRSRADEDRLTRLYRENSQRGRRFRGLILYPYRFAGRRDYQYSRHSNVRAVVASVSHKPENIIKKFWREVELIERLPPQ